MLIETFEQGSEEWHKAHLGIPTASEFGRIITPAKMQFSSQAEAFAYELIEEQDTGRPARDFVSSWMQWGKDNEDEARETYEFLTGDTVSQVGMVFPNEDRLYGCSPDGVLALAGDIHEITHGLEIKCPSPRVQIGYIQKNEVPTQYIPQIQGNMWICGVDTWDFFAYHPRYRHVLITVERDCAFIRKLRECMDRFLELIETTKQSIYQ